MKYSKDPRHLKRIEVMQDLFSLSFDTFRLNRGIKPKLDESKEIIKNLKKIDSLIEAAAPGRPLTQVNKIDIAILRLAVFELIIKKGQNPYKVIIDEAIELAKEYGTDSSAGFVNGVLGKITELKKL